MVSFRFRPLLSGGNPPIHNTHKVHWVWTWGGKDGISVSSMESRNPGHSRFIEVTGLYGLHDKCINMKRNRQKERKNKEIKRWEEKNTIEDSSVMKHGHKLKQNLFYFVLLRHSRRLLGQILEIGHTFFMSNQYLSPIRYQHSLHYGYTSCPTEEIRH